MSILDKKARVCCAISCINDLKTSKLLWGLLRYSAEKIDCIVVSQKPPSDAEVPNEFQGKPVFFDIQIAKQNYPKMSGLYVCLTPVGGILPASLIPLIIAARNENLTVIMGFHDVYGAIPPKLKSDPGVINIRSEESVYLNHYREQPRNSKATVILTVGSDNAVGKMTTALELANQLKSMRINSTFAPTGQTGVMITGDGVVADSISTDYLTGTISNYIAGKSKDHELVIVEGQGSITHSTVSLGLIQGARPDGMILCHDISRVTLKGYETNSIRELDELINIYEIVSSWFKPGERSAVIGVAVNTSTLEESKAVETLSKMQKRLHIPVTDPVRFGIRHITDSVLRIHSLKQPQLTQLKSEGHT